MAAANGGIYSEAGTKAFVNMLVNVLSAGSNITILPKEMGQILEISAKAGEGGGGGGGYEPPAGGIPKNDLSADVKALLDKANTALQSFTEKDPVYAADKEKLEAMLDKNVSTEVSWEENESTFALNFKFTNLKTGSVNNFSFPAPVSSLTKAGLMNAVMFKAFKEMQDDVAALKSQSAGESCTAVVSMLENDDFDTLTAVYTSAKGVSPVEGDRVLNASNRTEYVLDGNGDWIMLPMTNLSLATATNKGLVAHSEIEGTVGYYTAGIGEVNGWDVLCGKVTTNEKNISSIQNSMVEAIKQLQANLDNLKTTIETPGGNISYTGAFIPDYARNELVAKNTEWVANRDGFVVVLFSSSNASSWVTMSLYINNFLVFADQDAGIATGNYSVLSCGVQPVKKGDTIIPSVATYADKGTKGFSIFFIPPIGTEEAD